MIKIIKKIIIKNLFLKIYIFLVKKNFNNVSFEYNFKNIEFQDDEYLKKLIFVDNFKNNKIHNLQNYTYHSFDWLNIARKIGGENSIIKAKKHLISWNSNKYKKNTFVWNSSFISKRLVNIIYNYDFFASTYSKHDKNLINNIIIEHYLLLGIEINSKSVDLVSLEECKAIILLSLIYKKKIYKYEQLLKKIILTHVDNNGFHKSYNPLSQAKFINHLYEIKNIFLYFKIYISEELNFQLLNMTSLLKSLMHKDGSLALFNGSNNFYLSKIFEITKMEKDLKAKNLKGVKKGILYYSDKNKKVFMDIVKPVNQSINEDFHSGTLSFELSCLNEKIITNCGAVNNKYSESPQYLRYSAAHSTTIVNNTNISELIKGRAYKRAPQNITINSIENNESFTWEASHDGYLKNYQKIIKRKLQISKKSDAIFGQDEIISTKINSRKESYSIRFHLMPHCNCLITNDKKTILIKTKKNQSWVFKSNSSICIEDSIYIGNGKRVEQNKQIVIYGSIQNNKKIEKWSLIKS
jgi:uncharacterized heparinase superfamily protein